MKFDGDWSLEFKTKINARIKESMAYPYTTENTFKDADVLKEILGIRDRLKIILFCNPDDYEYINSALENQPGIYEIRKSFGVERGHAILLKNGGLKI